MIRNAAQFRRHLQIGPYADGGYPVVFVMRDGGVLCFRCASKERGTIAAELSAVRKSGHAAGDKGWLPEAWAINWENPSGETCDHCGKVLEAAYGQDDTPEEEDDAQCVCGVYRSEHAMMGCPEGFQTPAQWEKEKRAIWDALEAEDRDGRYREDYEYECKDCGATWADDRVDSIDSCPNAACGSSNTWCKDGPDGPEDDEPTVYDEPPPDYGPPGSGAVLTEYQ